MDQPLLEILDLRIGFPVGGGAIAEVVRDLTLTVHAGEVVGVVGESGSGKSMTALAVLRLVPPPGKVLGGRISFRGEDVLTLSEPRMREIRGGAISIVFQDPQTSLNPAFTVGRQLIDVIVTHHDVGRGTARERAIDALRLVGIPAPESRLNSYPHEFSGGMRQRALIAMAVACHPQLLIADEPTTALDVTVQAQVIGLLRRLRQELGLSIVFITHNLDLVGELCDRVAVMYAGTVVEEASVENLFTRPRHPYTQALIRCVPRLTDAQGPLTTIEGAPPAMGHRAPGCSFAPRCPEVVAQCRSEAPPLRRLDEHRVACWVAK